MRAASGQGPEPPHHAAKQPPGNSATSTPTAAHKAASSSMSKHTRRQTPASRNNRRAALEAKRNCDPDSAWDSGYGLNVGSYGGLDDRRKSRKKKHPLGFTAPTKRTRRKTG